MSSRLPLLLLLCACRDRPKEAAAPSPEFVLENVRARQFRGNTLRFSGTSPRIELARSAKAFNATHAQGEFYEKGIRLDAGVLEGDLSARVFVGSRGVELRMRDGVSAASEVLSYDDGLHRAWSQTPVWLQSPRFSLQASGFEGNTATQEFGFEQPRTVVKEQQP